MHMGASAGPLVTAAVLVGKLRDDRVNAAGPLATAAVLVGELRVGELRDGELVPVQLAIEAPSR